MVTLKGSVVFTAEPQRTLSFFYCFSLTCRRLPICDGPAMARQGGRKTITTALPKHNNLKGTFALNYTAVPFALHLGVYLFLFCPISRASRSNDSQQKRKKSPPSGA
jgi:hypothetical protein